MRLEIYTVVAAIVALLLALITEWTYNTPVYGREYCVRPPHMMTTTCNNRIPTPGQPYCPAPGY
jgi:hypothetical protein